ncbi:Hypothetical protein FKW44_018557, partial [Caligus rogercresseyi]
DSTEKVENVHSNSRTTEQCHDDDTSDVTGVENTEDKEPQVQLSYNKVASSGIIESNPFMPKEEPIQPEGCDPFYGPKFWD